MNSDLQSNRIEGIDVAKGLAITAVVLIHTAPFVGASTPPSRSYYLGQVIQQLCSWAVPFFFTAAAYLFSKRATSVNVVGMWLKYVSRLGVILIAWIVIDGVLSGQWLKAALDSNGLSPLYWNLLAIPSFAVKRPDLFFFRGTSVSLWFLVSLLVAMTALAVAIRCRASRHSVLVLGVLAYLLALGLGSYSKLLGQSGGLLLEQRGPLIAIGFVALGHFLADGTARMPVAPATSVLIAWFAVFVEAYAHSAPKALPFEEVPYLLSTFPLAAALLLYFVRQSPMATHSSTRAFFHGLGRRSLAIYLVHIPLLGAIAPFKPHWAAAELLLPAVLVLLSYGLSAVLGSTPYVRRIVA